MDALRSRSGHLFRTLSEASPQRRRALLATLSPRETADLCEAVLNSIATAGGCPLSPSAARRCGRHKHALRRLAFDKKLGWRGKKRIILQKGGGFWLLSVLASVLGAFGHKIF